MDPKSSKEISNNDLKCALGPTMAQRKVSEKENKLCTSKAQVCWGGGSLEVWCHTDKPTETAQPGVLLSRLELLQLLGPSWEVWDLVVDGQVLQRPQLVFYWVQGFCPSMNLAKANSCSEGIRWPKKGASGNGIQGISQSTWQRIPCRTMYPGGPVGCKFKVKISRKHILMYDYL